MININTSPATENFRGAYYKRVEQNRFKEAAEKYHAEQEQTPRRTVSDLIGAATVTISEESKEFLAGIADRKAAQRAEREAASQEPNGNVFEGCGDFKKQYLVLSENLYNNGFYNDLSDDEVKNMEDTLKQITSGMDSINGIMSELGDELSHEAGKVELLSSVNALNVFAEKYVPDEMKESFLNVVKQYESYNSEKVSNHKSMDDLRDESLSTMESVNTIYVYGSPKSVNEMTKASQEIGKVRHSEEEEQTYEKSIQELFDQLAKKESDPKSIFDKIQETFTNYVSGGSKNNSVLALIQARNDSAFSRMKDYWSGLLMNF